MKKKFLKSKVKNYRMTKSGILNDSESSILSLEGIELYDLNKQNDKKVVDCYDKLVELISELREIEKPRIYELIQ